MRNFKTGNRNYCMFGANTNRDLNEGTGTNDVAAAVMTG
jgi:hypothetical protein